MDIFRAFFDAIIDGMSIDFTVYGFTFSFMDLFIFELFVGIIASFFGWMLNRLYM